MAALPELDTAGNIVNRAAIQLGLLGVSVAQANDPFASQDPNFVQLCELLTSVGDDLNGKHNWPQLRQECVIVTVAGQNVYPLPADFHEMIDQSGWNRSARLPLIGPLRSQEWQYLKARALGMYISVVFRQAGGNLEINPGMAVPAGTTIAFEYESSRWVQSAGAAAPDKAAPTIGTDVVCYDSELAIAALKLAWLEAKGFDTAAAAERYEAKLEHAIGKSTGAPTLSLVGTGRTAVDRFIDNANLPLTGFGS
ncbi:phage adaptor protein [Anaeromyxobacter oryzisoli]|uniref:phage adaptor protein n=1 Tax=Anaeromyxobacter oryzisoli TaxID=2925408 RepID=UPI001F597764|nr:hypothetical protein [Anaeromyxobacter sp. SG63]